MAISKMDNLPPDAGIRLSRIQARSAKLVTCIWLDSRTDSKAFRYTVAFNEIKTEGSLDKYFNINVHQKGTSLKSNPQIEPALGQYWNSCSSFIECYRSAIGLEKSVLCIKIKTDAGVHVPCTQVQLYC